MKKWSFLVAALLMMSAAVTTTSCVDTDEPEGITTLRTAKAGYLNALAEVKKAEVAVKNAEAARINAAAEVKKADAAYRLAEARWQEAQAAIAEEKVKQEEANTAAAKAEAEKKIAQFQKEAEKYQQDMEENRIKAEANNIEAQKQLAIAKQAMDDVLKAIETSKVLDGVTFDKDNMNTVAKIIEQATTNVKDAKKDLVDALEDQEKAQKAYLDKVYSSEDALELLLKAIEDGKTNVAELTGKRDGANAKKAELKAALENASIDEMDVKTKYDKQYQDIQNQIDAFNKNIEDQHVKLAEVVATPEFRALVVKAYGIDKNVQKVNDLKAMLSAQHLPATVVPNAPAAGDPKCTVEKLEEELQNTINAMTGDVNKTYEVSFPAYLTGAPLNLANVKIEQWQGKHVSDVEALKVDAAAWNSWTASGLYYDLQTILDKHFTTEAKAVYKEWKNTSVSDAEKAYNEAKATWEALLKTYQGFDANAVKAAKEKVYKAGSPATGVFAVQEKATSDAATLCAGKKAQIDADGTLTPAQKTEQKAAADLEYANAVIAANKAKAAAVLEYYKTVSEKGSFAYKTEGNPAATKKIKLVNGEAYLDGITVKYRDRELTLEQWLSPDYADQFFKSVLGTALVGSMTQYDLLLANPYVEMKSKDDVKIALIGASLDAFGTAFLENDILAGVENSYMRVEPTKDEAKKVNLLLGGKFGAWIAATDDNTKNFLANYEQAEKDIQAAMETIAQHRADIDAYVNGLKEKAATYDKNWDDRATTWKDHSGSIKTAKDEATSIIAEAIALAQPMTDEIAKITETKGDLEVVQGELKEAIAAYLDKAGFDASKDTPAKRLEAYKESLKKKIEDAQKDYDKAFAALEDAEALLATNEKNLARLEENDYANVNLDFIIGQYEAKVELAAKQVEIYQAAYDKAVEELKAALDAASK